MEPISVIVGVSTIGYLLDQYKNINNFNQKQSNQIPVGDMNPCADQYPWNFVDNFEDKKKNQVL